MISLGSIWCGTATTLITYLEKRKKGSFWWRDILKLLNVFKSLSFITVANGSTVLLWKDKWNGQTLASDFTELLSFAKDKDISFQKAESITPFIQNFNLPLSTQAFLQFHELDCTMNNLEPNSDKDIWSYVWGSPISRWQKLILKSLATY